MSFSPLRLLLSFPLIYALPRAAVVVAFPHSATVVAAASWSIVAQESEEIGAEGANHLIRERKLAWRSCPFFLSSVFLS